MMIFKKRLIRWFCDGRRISAREAKALQAQGIAIEKRVQPTSKWYVRFRLPGGRVVERPGVTDKSATQLLASQWYREALQEAAGIQIGLERRLQGRVDEYLAAFKAELIARGRSAKHVRLTIARIQKVLAAGGVERLKDLQAQRVREAILNMPIAVETRNHYLVAIKAFSRWLWRQNLCSADSLAGLCRWNAEPHRQIRRRALSDGELAKLIAAAEASEWVFRKLTGADRAALYVLAVYSGLRASELASLTADDLELGEAPHVVVRAAYSKHRREDTVPLPSDVANYLRCWLERRPTRPIGQAKLWPGTWPARAAFMIQHDLLAAGIAPVDSSGRRVDFHALRCTYATLLARRGVNLQTAQALLRHCDARLTSRIYTRLGLHDLAKIVEGLRFPQRHVQNQEAAG